MITFLTGHFSFLAKRIKDSFKEIAPFWRIWANGIKFKEER
jgi:hypothetical protein